MEGRRGSGAALQLQQKPKLHPQGAEKLGGPRTIQNWGERPRSYAHFHCSHVTGMVALRKGMPLGEEMPLEPRQSTRRAFSQQCSYRWGRKSFVPEGGDHHSLWYTHLSDSAARFLPRCFNYMQALITYDRGERHCPSHPTASLPPPPPASSCICFSSILDIPISLIESIILYLAHKALYKGVSI